MRTQETVLSRNRDSIMISTPWRPSWHQTFTSRTGPIFVFPRSTLPRGMFPHFEIRCTLDMMFFISLGLSSSSVMKNCPLLNILRETSIGEEFGQFLLFRNFCEFLLVFTQQISLYFGISLRNRVSNKNFCRYHHWFQIFIRGWFPCTSWFSG